MWDFGIGIVSFWAFGVSFGVQFQGRVSDRALVFLRPPLKGAILQGVRV